MYRIEICIAYEIGHYLASISRDKKAEYRRPIAPQLIVVSTPLLNKTFEHMRGPPTLLGWGPTRRRYVQGQQFVHRPAMVRDPRRHGWRGLLDGAETLVRRAKVVDRAHHEHPLVQGQGLTGQRPAPTRQRREAFPERRVQPLDIRGVDDAMALRAPSERLDAGGRAVDNAAVGRDHPPPLVALDDLGFVRDTCRRVSQR